MTDAAYRQALERMGIDPGFANRVWADEPAALAGLDLTGPERAMLVSLRAEHATATPTAPAVLPGRRSKSSLGLVGVATIASLATAGTAYAIANPNRAASRVITTTSAAQVNTITSANRQYKITVLDTGIEMTGPTGSVKMNAAGLEVRGGVVTINGGGCPVAHGGSHIVAHLKINRDSGLPSAADVDGTVTDGSSTVLVGC